MHKLTLYLCLSINYRSFNSVIMKRKLLTQPIHWLYRGIFLYMFLFIPILLTAQQSSLDFCATEDIITDNSIYSFSDNISDLNNFPERTFNVYFWELRESDGDSRVKLQDEDFIRNINNLNQEFANSKICFNLKGHDVILSDEYHLHNPVRLNDIINYAKSKGKYMENAINVYVFFPTRGSGVKTENGLGVGKFQFKDNARSGILVHEVGHFLGLEHTFRGWISDDCENPINHQYGDYLEYNAEYRGDYVVDTNPVPNFYEEQVEYGIKALSRAGFNSSEVKELLSNENGFSVHSRALEIKRNLLNYGFTQEEVNHLEYNKYVPNAYIDVNTCEYIGVPRQNSRMFKNCNSIPFITMVTQNDVRNFMGYVADECYGFLSVGQSIRIHEQIELAINQNCPNYPDNPYYHPSEYEITWCANIVNALSSYDLYIKNSEVDIGLEPDNNSEHYLWESPDIWVRNQNDGLTNQEHQNPVYKTNSPNYVYVKVTNRSCSDYDGSDAELELTWSKTNIMGSASILMRNHIDDTGHFDNIINEISIPAIPAGESTILTFEWYPPNPDAFSIMPDQSYLWSYSLFTKINSPSDSLFNTSAFNFAYNNNNISALNVDIVRLTISPQEHIPGGAIAIGNYMFDTTKVFNFEFKNIEENIDETLWEEAEIIVSMDEVSWNKWKNGGYQSDNIEIFNEENKQVIITDNNAVLKNMSFEAGEWSIIHVGFNFLTQEVMHDDFYYHVFQVDVETAETMGSKAFKIARTPRDLFKAEATYTWSDTKNAYVLKADAINENAIYNWYDEDGELVFSSPEVILPVDASDKYKLEVISENDRYKDYDEIDVKNLYGITSISPNPSSDFVKITYRIPNTNNEKTSIKITPLNGIGAKTYSTNKDNISVDVSSYTTGIYIVSLIYEDAIIDTKNLIIK